MEIIISSDRIMYLAILSKLFAESLLSFYSIFVKKINIDLKLQIWSRFFTYVIISSFFVDWEFIYNSILSIPGLLLSLATIAHVYSSYRSFQLLDSGVATTLYYIYPIFILLYSGTVISPVLLVSMFGVYLISNDLTKPNHHSESNSATVKEQFWNEGIFSAFVAAITEAIIFFLVKNLRTMNNWNHLFLSYFVGAIGLTMYVGTNIATISLSGDLSISMLVNAFIGLFGYYLRFYAISRLDAYVYAPLSYFGIIMSYVYGVFLNNDVLTTKKIVGTLCIVFTNLYVLYFAK